MEATTYGAIVLAGGGARRMGGVRKPAVRVGGVPMIERVLAAVTPAGAPLVVGPSDLVLPPEVAVIQEVPPGGGPAAAVAAAFAASRVGGRPAGAAARRRLAPIIAIVAGDLPLLTAEAVGALLDAARVEGVDGAVYVDTEGRPQWLCGAWRTAALGARIATEPLTGTLAGVSLRDLFGALTFARLPAEAATAGRRAGDRRRGGGPGDAAPGGGEMAPVGRDAATPSGHPSAGKRAGSLPPWFDCDTEDDIRLAEEWLTR